MALRYSEVQRVGFEWSWLAFLFLVVLSAWRHSLFGVVFYGAVLVMILKRSELRIEVDDRDVKIRWPFAGKQTVPLSSIQRADVTTYYRGVDGACGVRDGQAVRLWLSTGNFVLVGTAHPEELLSAVTPS